MKKLLLTLVCILVLAPLAYAESSYVKGVTTATHADESSGEVTTMQLRVYVVTGPEYADDLIYIEGGGEESRISGYLFEYGRRGMANENTYYERERFEKALRKSIAWIKKAEKDGTEGKRQPDIFDSFDLVFQSMDQGRVARLSMKIWDMERGGSLQLYLDTEQIGSLLDLLAKVPETLAPLKEEIEQRDADKKERIRKAREKAGLE